MLWSSGMPNSFLARPEPDTQVPSPAATARKLAATATHHGHARYTAAGKVWVKNRTIWAAESVLVPATRTRALVRIALRPAISCGSGVCACRRASCWEVRR